jgi:hypothetical protein
MKRERKAQILTVLIMALALGFVLAKRYAPGTAAPAAAPESGAAPRDAIYAMLDAARAGDVKAYLAGYTGRMAASLRQSLAETGEPGFVKYLQESNAAIKNVAVAEPQTLTDREVKLRVEYVYQDRNESQWIYLEKSGAGWKIARVDGVERVKTLVPYGTPVP